MLGILNPSQIDHVLRREVIGRVGCYGDGRVYIVPISYVYDGESVYGHSADGMKVSMMRANPNVCFQVDHVDNLANWVSVVGWGVFEELVEEEAEKARQMFLDRMTPIVASETALSSHVSPVGGGHAVDMGNKKAIIYRIRLTERTGRFETR